MAPTGKLAATLIATIALVAGMGIAPASAVVPIGHQRESFTITTVNQECLAALPAGEDPAVCERTEEWVIEAEMQHITPTDPTRAAPPVDADQSGFEAALAAATVRSRNFSVTIWGGAYSVVMSGRYYYNGTRVWVNTSYSGRAGWLNCDIGYDNFPVTITNMVERDQGGTSARTVSCNYRVNFSAPPGTTWWGYNWAVARTASATGTFR